MSSDRVLVGTNRQAGLCFKVLAGVNLDNRYLINYSGMDLTGTNSYKLPCSSLKGPSRHVSESLRHPCNVHISLNCTRSEARGWDTDGHTLTLRGLASFFFFFFLRCD